MKNDEKVVKLVKKKNSFEDELLSIAKLISNESPLHPERDEPLSSSNHITGSGNIVGNGNFVNSGSIHINTPIQRKVYVRTGEGVVDASQKKSIKSLVYEWVDMELAIRKSPISYQRAWALLNGVMDVNSYHEIKKTDFDKAIKYLRTQLGKLRNMASAPAKVDDWRKKTIRSIQARCSERGWQVWRKQHMIKTFSKSSMTDLTDDEIKRLYQTVWNKK